MNLDAIRNQLLNLLSLLSSSTSLDFAIFDTQATLIASTESYLLRKGKTVHTVSIEEVLEHGNVIVNKPGLMKSCNGCRFANNCPSTIELLSCIKIENISIGVISLTSFTSEGHNLISNDIRKFVDIIKKISDVISNLIQTPTNKTSYDFFHTALDTVLEEIPSNHLIIDNIGNIVYWENSVRELFSHCNLYTQSIYQLLPRDITSWIMSSTFPIKQLWTTDFFTGTIIASPLYDGYDLKGFLLKFEEISNIQETTKLNYLDSIISEVDSIKEIKKIIVKIASSPSTVLITGATGTGKEMVAKAIHNLSNRSDYPMACISCANIPENLFESELFGYEDGTFTGAKKGGKAGIFEMANGGTIFLDEISELPQGLQAKLLRVLQEKTIQRIGSIKNIPVNVRIIAATNKDLELMVEEGTFREDLFYRLNIIPLEIPALKDRSKDIELLTHYFIDKHKKILNKHIRNISTEALNVLKAYNWPGNVRELENAVEYAMNMEESERITLSSLPLRILKTEVGDLDLWSQVSKNETSIIIAALERNGWDMNGKSKTAEELGISLRTLYRRLKE
jgi:transcriptional regulator with PAS, ATPase and Fis domain